MPVVYRCSRCGFPLYIFARVGQSSYGLQTPSEIIYAHGGRCPRCGKPLEPPRLDRIRIEFNVANAARRLYEETRRVHVPLTSLALHLQNVLSEAGEEATA